MTGYVIDASVAVEYLLCTPLGITLADTVEAASLAAPELLDPEVVSALRRAVLTGRLDEARAAMALSDLAIWPIDRLSHRTLALSAWGHYSSVSAYDAFYVAAARAMGVPLLTADGRLARSTGLDITVHHIRMS